MKEFITELLKIRRDKDTVLLHGTMDKSSKETGKKERNPDLGIGSP